MCGRNPPLPHCFIWTMKIALYHFIIKTGREAIVRSALVGDETGAGRLVVGERKRRIQQKRTKSPAAGKKTVNNKDARRLLLLYYLLFLISARKIQISQTHAHTRVKNGRKYSVSYMLETSREEGGLATITFLLRKSALDAPRRRRWRWW